MWGGVHVGEGPGDHIAEGHPLRSGSYCSAVEQDPVEMPGGLLRARVVHRGDRAGAGAGTDHRRLRAQIGAAIGDATRSVAEVAAAHGVSWPTAHRAFVDHADAALAEPAADAGARHRRDPPRKAPVGATTRTTGRWVRVDRWDTGFVDLDGDQGLLGQHEGRTGADRGRLADRAHAAVPRRDRVRGDRPGRGLRLGDPHAGSAAERDDRGRSLPPGQARPTTR